MPRRRLFELVTEDGCAISPYAWRSRYALAHKELPYEQVGVGFAEIGKIGPGTFKSVPVLQDEERWIGDSWTIAAYLDERYPNAPRIFSSPAEYWTVRFFEKWLLVEVVSTLFRICAMDIYARLRPADRPYFRQTREARLGHSLEDADQQRHEYVPRLREALQPLRLSLRERPFVGGETPNYADFVAIGAFLWAATVASSPLLKEDDPLLSWIDRSLALYGGIGKSLRLPGLGRS